MAISFKSIIPYRVRLHSDNRSDFKSEKSVVRKFCTEISKPKQKTPEMERIQGIFYNRIHDMRISENNTDCGESGGDKVRSLTLNDGREVRKYILTGKDTDLSSIMQDKMRFYIGAKGYNREEAHKIASGEIIDYVDSRRSKNITSGMTITAEKDNKNIINLLSINFWK